jgi:4'-phosphopantetheinyl transferase
MKDTSKAVSTWSSPPEWPTLAPDDVQVWLIPIDPSPTTVEQLRHLLSADERVRADRFHFRSDSNRFTVARAFLRITLGKYLRTDPGDIEFDYSKYGKPCLAPFANESTQLKFNLAHSGNRALYAFTRGREIGIDLERITPQLAVEGIARRFFSTTEVKLLEAVAPHVRTQAFFNCWTLKEAFVKAKGVGISLPLNQFDVTFAPFAPVVLLRTRWNEAEALRWSLQTIDAGADYVGAIAVEDHNWRLSCWQPGEIS